MDQSGHCGNDRLVGNVGRDGLVGDSERLGGYGDWEEMKVLVLIERRPGEECSSNTASIGSDNASKGGHRS
jgi:hypothetical protein